MSEDGFENFPTFSNFSRRLPKISEDLREFPKISKKFQKCWKVILSTLRKISEIFRRFPKTSEDFRRLQMISEDFIKNGRKVVLTSLQYFLIFSEDFRRFPKVFGNLSECLFLHSPVLLPKLSKEFPNIQLRRDDPLLPVTDRPLNFFMYVSNK